MALVPLLVFVVMSGQLYPLSLDSESDSEPDESESLNVSWHISSSLSLDSSFPVTTTSQRASPFISLTWVVIVAIFYDFNFFFQGRYLSSSKT